MKRFALELLWLLDRDVGSTRRSSLALAVLVVVLGLLAEGELAGHVLPGLLR